MKISNSVYARRPKTRTDDSSERAKTCSVKTSHCVIFRGHFSSRQNCTQFIIGKLLFQARLLGDSVGGSVLGSTGSSMTGSSIGNTDGRSTSSTASSSSSSSSSMMSTSSKCLSKFSSPFKRRKNKAKNSTSALASSSVDQGSTQGTSGGNSVADFEQLLLAPDNSHREEMLRLFILKLDEEANYFQVSASPEEELCDCQKCQVTHSLFCRRPSAKTKTKLRSLRPLWPPGFSSPILEY